MKTNKYLYLWVVQGFYAIGWEDLTCSEIWIEARNDLKSYRANEKGTFRMIKRREVRTWVKK